MMVDDGRISYDVRASEGLSSIARRQANGWAEALTHALFRFLLRLEDGDMPDSRST